MIIFRNKGRKIKGGSWNRRLFHGDIWRSVRLDYGLEGWRERENRRAANVSRTVNWKTKVIWKSRLKPAEKAKMEPQHSRRIKEAGRTNEARGVAFAVTGLRIPVYYYGIVTGIIARLGRE